MELELEKSDDYLLVRLIYRKLSIPITRKLALTGVTPNQITIFDFLLVILSAILISTGKYEYFIVSAFLIQFSGILDCVDGGLARIKKLESQFGEWFDRVTDKLKELIIYTGLAMAYYQQTKSYDAIVLLLALVSVGYIYNWNLIVTRDTFGNSKGENFKGTVRNISIYTRLNPKDLVYYTHEPLFLISIGLILNQIFFTFLLLILIPSFITLFIWGLVLIKYIRN